MKVKKIKIVSWNVNGIIACAKRAFLEWLDHEAPDICCLQKQKVRKIKFLLKLEKTLDITTITQVQKKKAIQELDSSAQKLPEPKITEGIGDKKF